MIKLTQDRLKAVLNYNPKTGLFTRTVFRSSNAKKGDVAGSLTVNGYFEISIDNIRYLAHRLAFLYMIGHFPEHNIDHINGIRNDNKWCNLREVSQSCNIRNGKIHFDNKSGVTGVFWYTKPRKWAANIFKGKRKWLGCFKNFDEAVCHRLAAEQCLDWKDCKKCPLTSAHDYIERLFGRKLKTKKWKKIQNQIFAKHHSLK